jgi:dihydroorotase
VKLIIQNGRVIDPAANRDQTADLLIEDGRVRVVAAPGSIKPQDADVLDAKGRLVVPGLVDLHVHLREPGEEYKEDIASGARAATAGGFCSIVAMANTKPPIDSAELVRAVLDRGAQVGLCRVFPVGSVTAGRAGKALAPLGEMRRAGAVAVSDDGTPVADAQVMRRALEYAQDFDLCILDHADEPRLSLDGHMHEGEVSTRLGLRGMPAAAEEIGVARDILLAETTGGRLHLQHISTARAVDLVRAAKAREVRVTAEATPHHFTLTHTAVEGYDPNTKMSPPLREEHDRQAIIAALADGTLDAIATDHAPHSSIEKDMPFGEAAHGIIGLQTALPLALELWRSGAMSLATVLTRLTAGPARVLGLPCGTLAEGAPADVTIIDPDASWTLGPETNLSKSQNSPWWGKTLRGRADVTIVGGRVVYHRGRNPVWSVG